MTIFSVKVTTRHEGRKRTCKLDVIATDWVDAGRKALELVQPQGAHRLSVSIAKQRGSASFEFAITTAMAACYAGLIFNLPLSELFSPSIEMLNHINTKLEQQA